MNQRVTNGNAFDMLVALEGAANECGQLGFAIAKNRRIIKAELEEYIKKRDEIILKYATKDNNGQLLIDDSSSITANAELSPYSAMECEVKILKVPESVFCGGTLTSEQMFNLDFMVKEDDKNEFSGCE